MKKPKNIIFESIVGSEMYNLNTETSDQDIKGIYIQSNEEILSNKYIPQIDVDKDTVYYELRRFLELVSVGNPNVLELLYAPERCVLKTSEKWKQILDVRDEFLSKKCYETFSGYARGQLYKAQGLNRKFNWESSRIERKDIIDFCKILEREDGRISPMKDWLKENEYNQEHIGLTSIDGFRDCYKVYVDELRWAGDNQPNHRFRDIDFSDRDYKGIIGENSNEPRKSVIEKYMVNQWKGVLYWNRESYSTHCKEYSQYEKWLKNRNEDRVATNKKHGQQLDGKNLLHTVRLIMTAAEIPLENRINVERTKGQREYLLAIKRGEVDLHYTMKEWSQKADDLKELYVNSKLKEEVDKEFICNLELKLRNEV